MTAWKAPLIGERPILLVGAGVMGRRIACLWVAAGFNVNIQDEDACERAEAMQYVVGHVEGYMTRIESKKRGAATSDENLNTASSANPWLVIEALPELSQAVGRSTATADLIGYLDGLLPEDCIICKSTLSLSKTFSKSVTHRQRVLNVHHYLVPNLRVIEMIRNEYTDPAIIGFLSDVIPRVGALPIIARSEKSAMVFRETWISFRDDVLDLLGRKPSPKAIDRKWEFISRECTADSVDFCFTRKRKQFDDVLEENYTTTRPLKRSILSQLKDIFSNAIKVPPLNPYNGLCRAGPDVYFVDIGIVTSESSSTRLGRILCGSTDGIVHVLVDHLSLPYGLDIHLASKTIYWSDLTDHNISVCNLTGNSRHIVVADDGRPAPEQIVIDQVASQVYWTQSEGTQILRSNLDGTSIEVVFEASVSSRPVFGKWSICLSLDPSRRHFYWSQPQPDNEQKFRILRASMDLSPGSTAAQKQDIEIVFDDLPQIYDIDFVPVFDELYWSAHAQSPMKGATDVHRGDVSSVETYSDEKQHVVVGEARGIGWLKVDPKGGQVYTSSLQGMLARFDMTTGRNRERIHRHEVGSFAGIALIYKEWKLEDVDEQECEKKFGASVDMDGKAQKPVVEEDAGPTTAVRIKQGEAKEMPDRDAEIENKSKDEAA